jgi:hypothetical protein
MISAAQAALESDVAALQAQAKTDPKAVYTRDTADYATNLISWHRGQIQKLDAFVRVV